MKVVIKDYTKPSGKSKGRFRTPPNLPCVANAADWFSNEFIYDIGASYYKLVALLEAASNAGEARVSIYSSPERAIYISIMTSESGGGLGSQID